MAFDHLTFYLNTTYSIPTEKDLRILVVMKVTDYHALGTMLGLKFKLAKMFKKEQGGDTVLIIIEILTTWIEDKTVRPTTRLPLI